MSTLASNLKNAPLNEILYCNKIISKVYHNAYQLNYIKINGKQKIVAYTDASCENLKNSGSQGAYLIFLMGENNFCNLLSWQSKQLKRVARSSLSEVLFSSIDNIL